MSLIRPCDIIKNLFSKFLNLFLRDVEKQKVIEIPRFLSVLHSDLLNKV